MLPNTLAELLKLPAGERIEIAMASWKSLTDAEREAELALTAGLDARGWYEVASPSGRAPT
ncbi:MAG: hypothetical protein A2W08_13575 [Candidatus Rokubacteria bacterium RBG_16_73_20]|nr:MAG: hypothetical protein A2X52_20150 [Candidatus Rokubacteria bacterium GWC2_70_16]OGK96959.1 MAG: hypothetical protein A2W08_13575 [Candidatus Rokubacteria bacterium RBG_16_73_20]HBH00910.1 hypothetical protein [Candidatus Rokubacteria bacterium]